MFYSVTLLRNNQQVLLCSVVSWVKLYQCEWNSKIFTVLYFQKYLQNARPQDSVKDLSVKDCSQSFTASIMTAAIQWINLDLLFLAASLKSK